MATTDASYLTYGNQGATRNLPLDPALISAMGFLGGMGVRMNVVSGGQSAAGEGGSRTGSTRHDHGNAADVDYYIGDRRLDWNNPADLPILAEIVTKARANGVTGIGASDDYMGAGRMHIGFGNPAVWGAGGSSANAPDWLVAAYNAGAGVGPTQGATPGATPGNSLTPGPSQQPMAQNALAPPVLQVKGNYLDPAMFRNSLRRA